MNHSSSTSDSHIPVSSAVDNNPETNLQTFFTTVYLILFQCLTYIATISGCLHVPLRHLWAHYYPRLAFGEEAVIIMPPSTLTFIINAFLAFIEIKSQSQPGFPFQTHPQLSMFSVTSLLMYGLASAAELFVSIAGLDPASVYAVISHLGRIGSLCVLVVSLASLFYF